MKKVVSIVLNNFKNDSRVLKENISLQTAGYKVKVVALYEKSLKEYEVVNNIEVHRIKLITRTWSKKKVVQLFKYFEFIKKTVQEYKDADIIHCNDLNTLPIGVIIKKFFNKNVKIVYDAHEYETETNGLSSIEKKMMKKLEKFLIRFVNKTITVSDSIARDYEKLYNIEKPALVLNTPYYKDIEPTNIFREKFHIPKEKSIFLYQGALNSGRGIEIILDAFKDLDEKCVVVFMGYGILSDKIKEYMQKYNNIYFLEAVSPEVVLDYTASADFGISTIEDTCLSYRYCLPNKMFEYLMSDLPVMVSNLPEMKKIIEEFQVGVVLKENSVDGIKEAVKKSINLNKKELLENIRLVKSQYHWQLQEDILLKIYNEL